MSHRTSAFVAASVASVLALTGSAQAVFFSFPSDSDGTNFTFRGSAGAGNTFTMTQAGTPTTNVTLYVDDNNGPQAAVTFNVGFTANLTATWVASNGIGSFFQHSYLVSGQFAFVDRNTGAQLLICDIGGGNDRGLFTAPGSEFAWSTVGAALGSDTLTGPNAVTWRATQAFIDMADAQGVNLGLYDIFPGASVSPDDFGFDLTFLNSTNGGTVQLDPTTRTPTGTWQSEASFSGSAPNGIPTPGAASMLALGGLLLARRRR